jgi:hypothetical protein
MFRRIKESIFHCYGFARIGIPHALGLMDPGEPNLGKEKEILFVCLFFEQLGCWRPWRLSLLI